MMANKEFPLVTVCVITYNHNKFIKSALESILEQRTSFWWNIIIADDFSTDGTTEIIKEFASQYPDKIKLILQNHNVGLNKNFIDLFGAAQSKYVAFLDGDDVWSDPIRLEKQFHFLENNPEYAMVYGKHTLMDEAGIKKSYRKIPSYKSGYIFKDILLCKFLPPMAAALIRNSEVKKIYLNNNAPGIDFFLIASICKNNKVAFLNENYFCYRINNHSITNSQRPYMSDLFLKNIMLFHNEYPEFVKKGIKNFQQNQLYLIAEKEPTLKHFYLLVTNFRFSSIHIRQQLKCFLNLIIRNLK